MSRSCSAITGTQVTYEPASSSSSAAVARYTFFQSRKVSIESMHFTAVKGGILRLNVWGIFLSFPSPTTPFLPSPPSFSLSFSSPYTGSPSIQLDGLWERCKLSQRFQQKSGPKRFSVYMPTLKLNKKDGYRQRNVRQFTVSAISLYKAQFGYLRRVTPVCRCLHPFFSGGGIWLRQESLRHILASPGYAPGTIAVNVKWIEREFNAGQTHRNIYPSIFNCLRAIIIIICEFIRRTVSTRRLNLRRRQSLGGGDGSVKWKARWKETSCAEFWRCDK